MRFATVAAFFAAGAIAGYAPDMSTVYETEVATITSCAPEVPDCPAATSTAYPETEVPEPEPTVVPTYGYGNGSSPYPSEAPEPECPGYSVKTISTSITTVIPTVIYETVDVPCETETPVPSGSYYPTGGYASPSTGSPSTTETPVFTGGAATMGVSFIAAAAGLVALFA